MVQGKWQSNDQCIGLLVTEKSIPLRRCCQQNYSTIMTKYVKNKNERLGYFLEPSIPTKHCIQPVKNHAVCALLCHLSM